MRVESVQGWGEWWEVRPEYGEIEAKPNQKGKCLQEFTPMES